MHNATPFRFASCDQADREDRVAAQLLSPTDPQLTASSHGVGRERAAAGEWETVDGASFLPYADGPVGSWWTGYYSSRPALKRLACRIRDRVEGNGSAVAYLESGGVLGQILLVWTPKRSDGVLCANASKSVSVSSSPKVCPHVALVRRGKRIRDCEQQTL